MTDLTAAEQYLAEHGAHVFMDDRGIYGLVYVWGRRKAHTLEAGNRIAATFEASKWLREKIEANAGVPAAKE